MGLQLNEAERQTALWLKVTKQIEARLMEMRKRNDGNLDVVETAKLRGRIAELKFLLDLDAPSPATTSSDD